MRPFSALLAGVFLLLHASALAARGGDFEQGNAHFEKGRFAEAAGAYERAVRAEAWSANLFYNLGNAYFRLGERGRAVLNYRRALVLDPRHPEAAANLAFVRQQLGIPPDPGGAVNPRAASLLVPASVWAGSLGGWLALGGGIVALWRGLGAAVRRRGALTALTLGLPLLVLGGGAAWGFGAAARATVRTAVVLTPRADAHYAPADNSKVAANLTEGHEVRLLLRRGPWDYIELADGRRAFIAADRLEPLAPNPRG